jgi:hypothetical protein
MRPLHVNKNILKIINFGDYTTEQYVVGFPLVLLEKIPLTEAT